MGLEYTIEIAAAEQEWVPEKLINKIQEKDEVTVKEPRGALGVVEVATIIIAISAGYDLVTSLAEDINKTSSDAGVISRIHDEKEAAKLFIQSRTHTDANKLTLESWNKNGLQTEMVFSDGNRKYKVSMNKYDIELNEVEFEVI